MYGIKPQREYVRYAVTSTFGDYIRFAITYKVCGLDKTKKEHDCFLKVVREVALRAISHALPLVSKLPDGLGGDANPMFRYAQRRVLFDD